MATPTPQQNDQLNTAKSTLLGMQAKLNTSNPATTANTTQPTTPTTPTTINGVTRMAGETDTQYQRRANRSLAPAVLTPKSAIDHITNTMQPAMQQGNDSITAQNNLRAQNDTSKLLPGETLKDYSIRATKGTPPPTTTTPPPADIPETGQVFHYNQTTGEKIQSPAGSQPLPGYDVNPPKNPALKGQTVTASAQGQNGETYNQYSDGTFGKLDATGNFVAPVSSTDFNTAQQNDPNTIATSIRNALSSLSAGAIPLSPAQQAQIDGLKTTTAQQVADMATANANYAGATQTMMALYGIAGSQAGVGAVKAAVESGAKAILALQNDAAVSLAKMTDAFQSENYKDMRAHYEDLKKSNDDIQTHIDNMRTQAEKLRMDNETVSNNLRTYNLEVKKDDENQKQRIFDNKIALRTAAREEALAHSTMARNTAEIDKIKSENVANLNIMGGTVLGTNGAPDPQKQSALLAEIAKKNPGLAQEIKAAADYRLPLTSRFFQTSKGQAFAQTMLQYDPNWDAKQYEVRSNYLKSLGSGTIYQGVQSANKAVNHLTALDTGMDKVGNYNLSNSFNSLVNTVGKNIGNTSLQERLGTADTEALGVKDELAKFFKGTGASDVKSIEDWGSKLSTDNTPSTEHGVIQGAINLFTGQLKTMNEGYKSTMGTTNSDITSKILQPETIQRLSSLKDKGYEVDIPGVFYSPAVFAQKDPNASVKLDKARELLKQANDPDNPPTPENISQYAQMLP